MPPTMKDIEEKLRILYQSNPKEYADYLNMVKGMGYRVFRNSKGIHRVQMDMTSAFGGIFANIFGEGNQ